MKILDEKVKMSELQEYIKNSKKRLSLQMIVMATSGARIKEAYYNYNPITPESPHQVTLIFYGKQDSKRIGSLIDVELLLVDLGKK